MMSSYTEFLFIAFAYRYCKHEKWHAQRGRSRGIICYLQGVAMSDPFVLDSKTPVISVSLEILC